MIIVNERPCNGVDMSHWNKDFTFKTKPKWLKFFGHKAAHFDGEGMKKGIDPKLAERRKIVTELEVPWRAYYMWICPTTMCRAATQVNLLIEAVGDLEPGDSVYLDWEDHAVTARMVDEISYYMNLEFKNRWFMYVNDTTQDMTSWMETNANTDLVPVMHPNYHVDGGRLEALRWASTIWQTGDGIPPEFGGTVPIDYVMRPDLLNEVCGRK